METKAYQLAPLVRLTDATDCGSSAWITPSVEDCKPCGPKEAEMMALYAAGQSIPDTYKRLRTQAATWPTPSARDWKGAPSSEATLPTNSRPLNEVVRMFPTPMARDA